MARLTGLLAAAAIVGLAGSPASAQTRPERRPEFMPVGQQGQLARLSLGAIQGTILDDRGAPLADAMVSALSPFSTRMVMTDLRGRFRIQALPPGEYVLRINRAGFLSTRRDGVRIGLAGATAEVDRIQLRRVDDSPLAARPVLTAGVALPAPDAPTADPPDSHTETAWRLRHIKRSVLKEDGAVVSIADAAADQPVPPPGSSIFGRAFDSAANVASSFFTATPFSGEINFLTTSALGAGSIFAADLVPRGVAYISIGAPAASGRWDVRASMSQSDMSAWIVAGSFTSHGDSAHDYGFGVTYSTQQYQDVLRPLAPTGSAQADDAHNVGELYGTDRWTLTPALAIDYGARYAHYDYLRERSLISPHAGVTLTPFAHTHITAHAAQRMLAPGAEEFLAPVTVGPWLPPERTFAPLEGESLRVERARFLDVGIDHEFAGTYVLGVRRIDQRVDDQLVTLFGVPVDGGPQSPGHYFVASGGDVQANGWAVRVSSDPARRVRGSVDYSVTRAEWVSRGDMAAIAVWAPAAIRPRNEDIHDLTTSFETDVPQTATRVFVLYKVNTAFAHDEETNSPALDYRFDVQVNQGLPFMPFSRAARWEVLVGLRNLFRDPNDPGSAYDELLVIRPPKRLIGGVLVRF
jgi:hypothetical protein